MHPNNILLDNQAFLREMKKRHPSPKSKAAGKEPDRPSASAKQETAPQGSSERPKGDSINQAYQSLIRKATSTASARASSSHTSTNLYQADSEDRVSNLPASEHREGSVSNKQSDTSKMKLEQMANKDDEVFGLAAGRQNIPYQANQEEDDGHVSNANGPPRCITFEHHEYVRANLFPKEVLRRFASEVSSLIDIKGVKSGDNVLGLDAKPQNLLDAPMNENEGREESVDFPVMSVSTGSLLGDHNLPGQVEDSAKLFPINQQTGGNSSQPGVLESKPTKIKYDAGQLRAVQESHRRAVASEADLTAKASHQKANMSPVNTSPQLLLSMDTPPSKQKIARTATDSGTENIAKAQEDPDVDMWGAEVTRPLKATFTTGQNNQGAQDHDAGDTTESGPARQKSPNVLAPVFEPRHLHSVEPKKPATTPVHDSQAAVKPESQKVHERTVNKAEDVVMKDSNNESQVHEAVVQPTAKAQDTPSQPKVDTNKNPFAKFSRPGGSIFASASPEVQPEKARSLSKPENQYPAMGPPKGLGASMWASYASNPNPVQPLAPQRSAGAVPKVASKRLEIVDPKKLAGLPENPILKAQREVSTIVLSIENEPKLTVCDSCKRRPAMLPPPQAPPVTTFTRARLHIGPVAPVAVDDVGLARKMIVMATARICSATCPGTATRLPSCDSSRQAFSKHQLQLQAAFFAF